MGTRNLTVVIQKSKPKIAQYGQWDGYPEGQGVVVLDFLRKAQLDKFKEKLKKTKFINRAKQKEINEFAESIGSKNGWMTLEQSAKYQAKYPLLTRDNGASILELIYESEEPENWIHNSYSFGTDSVFCEYAYVIDLDTMKFEVYKGFNKTPLTPNDRFYGVKKEKDVSEEYQPVIKIVEFDINKLPTKAEFLKQCKLAIKKFRKDSGDDE